MTTRDARDEEPRGAERDAGDTNDELAGEDSKLSAMRSVWLAMRDEEPSSGGLAELMAAARGKAAELAPTPTWWQRVVAGLRRPPALAFATVLVLLGGALVVGRQLEREGAPAARWASEPQRPRPAVVGGATPAAGPAATGHGTIELEQTRMAAPPPPAPGPAVNDAIEKREVAPAELNQAAGEDSRRVIASEDRPRPTASSAPARPTTKPKAVMDDERAVEPTNEPTTTLSAGAVVAPARDVPAAPARDVPAAPARDVPAAPARDVPAAPAPAAATSDGSKLDRAEHSTGNNKPPVHRGATPPALYRQCAAAATRGDCAEVRRLVDQISTTDRRYRTRVAPATPIAKCLAE